MMQSRTVMGFLVSFLQCDVLSYGHYVVFPKILSVTRDDFICFFFVQSL